MLKICVLGRSDLLLNATKHLALEGHEILMIATAKEDFNYTATVNDFKSLAQELDSEFFCWPLTDLETIKMNVLKLGCEVGVSLNWPSILPVAFIDSFPLGILNAHAGDLPRFRGNACANWAIINGEVDLALTIHLMDSGLDSGPIVLKEYLAIDTSTYIGDIYKWLGEVVPRSISRALELRADSDFIPRIQPSDPGESLRTYPRKPSDGLIDWSLSSEKIHRLIRASSHPFSGAFTFLEDGTKVTVWRATPVKSNGNLLAVPGQVCFEVEGNPVIASGDGLVRLDDVSVEGLPHSKARELILSSFRNRLVNREP